jgi:predicted kinase
VLVVFGGLPATGKTAIARAVAQASQAAYVRVDAIEAALLRAGLASSQTGLGPAGYVVAVAVAETALGAGSTVVVDGVNPVEPARAGWRSLAERAAVELLFVEVTCSNPDLHRQRALARSSDFAELAPPTWAQITDRQYEAWTDPTLVIDNVGSLPTLARHVKRVLNAMPAQ